MGDARRACSVDRIVNWLKQVEDEICSHNLLEQGQRVVVAVSGGLDSMVLLHALHLLAPNHRWKLVVAHFNHKLRGAESDGDEAFVRLAAKKYQLPFETQFADVKEIAQKNKISIEMAARKSRHEFLAAVAKRQKATRVALAHHANDQVELCLLRLLRGSGGEGLAGMKILAPSPVDSGVSLIRPFLRQTRTALLDFAKEHSVAWREDATNESVEMQRNEIRHRILPRLREFQPALETTVLRSMEIIGDEAEFVRLEAERWLKNPSIDFGNLAVAVQRRVVEQQLRLLGVPYDFELVEFLRTIPDRYISPAAGFEILRRKSGIIEKRETSTVQFESAEVRIDVSTNGQTKIGCVWLNWRKMRRSGASRVPKPQFESFDAQKVGSTVILRFWRPGDRFQPIGMKKAVKLQDLFTNLKIPAASRRTKLIAATETGEIFWVEDLRIADSFKLTPATKERLIWSWKKT